MASKRFNQVTCVSGCHEGIDPGTLNLNLSNPPGIIGGLTDLASAVGGGALWAKDAAGLYATLSIEGLGFLVDVYGGKQGGGARQIAEAWDQRINNMAGAHAKFSRVHRVGAMPQYDALARWFAGTDPMKRRLLDHYIEGQGEDYELTLDEMKLMPTYIDLFETKDYSPNLRTHVEGAKKGKAMPVDVKVSGQNDALGNFAVHLVGVVKPAKGSPTGSTSNPYPNKLTPADPGVPLMFEGEMDWGDYWDFDPKVALRLQKRTGRGARAEAAVNAVAALVDGVPFQVTSVTASMTQFSGRFPDY